MRRFLVTIALLGACQASAAPSGDAEPAAAAQASGPALDERDQYALLTSMESAITNPLHRDAGAIAVVQKDWQGRRYRWEVANVPVFCRSAATCHVAPFDHGRSPDRKILQGWMPQLELDDAGFTELGRICAGRKVCVVQFEGTMRELVFDAELATAVRFADVKLLGARDGGANESWIGSRPPRKRA